MNKYYICSFSGGKDSTAMLLHLLELNEPIDEVLFCDTYKEFPDMYKHIEKVKKVVEEKGIKFTTLKSSISFDDYMFNYQVKHRNPEKYKEKYGDVTGYSWAGAKSRWCTAKLKVNIINKYLKELNREYEVYQYVGLAADETKRLERESNKNINHIHPLVDWGWSEKDCLDYCYSLGYDWNGLYQHFDRVSCWCCPLQRLDELRALKEYYPELWQELLEMDRKTWRQFKAAYDLQELDKRFDFEKIRIADGKSIRNREFFQELKEYLDAAD